MSAGILIVDDDSEVRAVLSRKMEQCGHHVTVAADGAEAITQLEQVSFDLAITDIVMPEMDGLTVIRFIRRQAPGTKIIAMSAPSDDDVLQSAAKLGAHRTLEKPFTLDELADAVDALLAG